MTYTVVLLREEEGGYSVSVPALKGCHTQGESLGEALLMAEEAIRLYLEVWVEDGKPIPPDKPRVTVNMEEATEALVYRLTIRELASVAQTADHSRSRGRDLKRGTLRGITRDAGLNVEEFRRLLK